MPRAFFVSCMSAALCAAALAPPQADAHSFVGGRNRTYELYRPAGLNRAHPMSSVIVLHGGSGSERQAERSCRWDAAADRGGFVVAYPDGVRRSWNAGGICFGRARR